MPEIRRGSDPQRRRGRMLHGSAHRERWWWPRNLVQHDVDTTAVGDPIGLVSTVNQVDFPTWEPEHCVELLRQLGFAAVTGRVATGDWFAVQGRAGRLDRGTPSTPCWWRWRAAPSPRCACATAWDLRPSSPSRTTCFPTTRRRNTLTSARRWKIWDRPCCLWPWPWQRSLSERDGGHEPWNGSPALP